MRTAIAIVATAVTLPLAGCGNGSAPLNGQPPPLELAGVSAAADALVPGDAGWRLSGALPSGTPAPEPVRRPQAGAAARDTVTRLAHALGVAAPQHTAAGWTTATTFTVRDTTGRPWQFGPDVDGCSPAPAGGGDTMTCHAAGTGVAVAPPACRKIAPDVRTGCVLPRSPAPAPKPLAPSVARRGASTVLDALGQSVADAAVQADGIGGAVVLSDPVIDGRPTSGLPTTVGVDRAGRVQSGSGWLVAVTRGPAYPLITARAAFAALQRQPRPLPAMACRLEGPCGEVAPRVVTGATLGLSLQYRNGGEPLLVPSWLFEVAGADQPVAQVAVEPRFLVTPTSPPGDLPSAVPPVQGGRSTTPQPAAPAPVPRPRVTSYTESSDGRTLTVSYSYGVCPAASYRAEAKEDATSVTVVISAYDVTPQPADTACIELARAGEATVALAAPLGDRTVRDEDGAAVARG